MNVSFNLDYDLLAKKKTIKIKAISGSPQNRQTKKPPAELLGQMAFQHLCAT